MEKYLKNVKKMILRMTMIAYFLVLNGNGNENGKQNKNILKQFFKLIKKNIKKIINYFLLKINLIFYKNT